MNDALVQERHDRQTASEDERAGLGEKPGKLAHRACRGDAVNSCQKEGRHHCGDLAVPQAWRRLHPHRQSTRSNEEPDNLGLENCGRCGGHTAQDPKEVVASESQPRQLDRASRDDGDDGCADAIEDPLHPGEPAKADVKEGKRDHHKERRQHERRSDERGSPCAAPDPAQIHGQLRREGSGRKLRKREPLDVVLFGDPTALLNQVSLHVARKRDRSAETEGP